MPNEHRPLKVFLCHAHADRDTVRAIYTRLKREGVDVWLDKEKLLPGADWEYEIRKAVRESDVVIVCLSKQFNQAGFRQKEVRIALDTAMEKPEGEIFIIPARLEECDSLESLSKWHWVDLFESNGFQRLITTLRIRANRIGATLRIRKSAGSTAPRPTSGELETKAKAEQETAEKARLEAEELARQKIARELAEKADRDAAEKAARTKAEEEAAEKARRNAAELARQKTAEKKVEIEQLSEPPVPIFKPRRLRKPNTTIIVAVIGLVGTLGAALISSPLLANLFAPTPTATRTPAPSETPTRVVTPTKAFTPTVTLFPTQITDPKGVTMRLVPAGEFSMGSDSISDNEKPVHQVYLDAYYMDKYEVTNASYRTCVDAGQCTPPQQANSISRSRYYGYSEFDDYPVIYVDWNQAKTYCEWRGASLPTEAQWEKAARGTDGRTYPWGEGIDCTRANFGGPLGGCKRDTTFDTTRVGSYESGQSPFGIYDMVGNVWEWVADWYEADYYHYSPSKNPLGPRSDQNPDYSRSLRGGSWYYGHPNSVLRHSGGPGTLLNDVGFRCARSLP